MNFEVLLFSFLWLPFGILGFGVVIEGLIDLGPKWNYKYKLSPINNKGYDIFNSSNLREIRDDNQVTYVRQQQLVHGNEEDAKNVPNTIRTESNREELQDSKLQGMRTREEIIEIETSTSTKNFVPIQRDLFNKKYKVQRKLKDLRTTTETKQIVNTTVQLHNFTRHIFKQSLEVFNNMLKISKLSRLKRKIKSLKKSFIKKFNNFLEWNKTVKIKTNLGVKKLISNTIDTSNNILIRLVNQLSTYIKQDKSLRNRANIADIFRNEINREKQIEYIHACEIFRVCHSHEDFSDFIIELLTIILQTDNDKVKQAADALTEVMKATDFHNIINDDIQVKIKKVMNDVEFSEPHTMRAMFLIMRNVIVNRNIPMVVMNVVDSDLANRTVAFHNLLEIFDKNIRKTDNNNSKEWEQIKKEMHEWKNGFRADILKIFEKFINMIKKVLDKTDEITKQKVNEYMKLITKPIKKIK